MQSRGGFVRMCCTKQSVDSLLPSIAANSLPRLIRAALDRDRLVLTSSGIVNIDKVVSIDCHEYLGKKYERSGCRN